MSKKLVGQCDIPQVTNTLEHALEYLARGFSVIPIKRSSDPKENKKPNLSSWKEYQERVPTSDELSQWFGNGSENNIGIVTGKVSEIAVVDLDSKKAVEFAKDSHFPETPTVKTSKGYHYHLYYAYKEGVRNFQKRDDLPDIDLRGEGGCVVAPPSIHASGHKYEWVTGKGLDDLPLAELPEIILAKNTSDKTPIKELYHGVPEGERNDSLTRLVGSWASDGLTYEECLKSARMVNEKNIPPLPDKEVEQIVNSIYKRHEKESIMSKNQIGNDGPEIKDSNLFPIHPFPLEVFPMAFLKDIQLLSDALHVEPELVASAKLAILSGALGNTIRVSPKKSFEVAPFLWLIIIASSGYGKTPAIETLLSHVRKLQARASRDYRNALEAYEAISKSNSKAKNDIPELSKPKLRHYLVSDCTVEALARVFENDSRGCIIAQDEIAKLMLGLGQYKNKKGNDLQHYLELFNCNSWVIDRKLEHLFIPNTGAAIIGGIQPNVLPKVFKEESFDDGLLPRFLLLKAEDRPQKFSRQAITDEAISHWKDLLDWCYSIEIREDEYGCIKPQILILSDEALDLWVDFYDTYGHRFRFLSEKAKVFIPKLSAYYSLKFAGLLHAIGAFESGGDIGNSISEDTVRHSIALTHYFAGQCIKTLDLYKSNQEKSANPDTLQLHLIQTLHELQSEVVNGQLPITRITEAFNSGLSGLGGLPEQYKLTPKKIGSMIRTIGLTTDKSTGGVYYLIWDTILLGELFSKHMSTKSTMSTPVVATSYESPISSDKHSDLTDQDEVFDLAAVGGEIE